MEIKNIISEAEKKSFDGDYEAAIIEIQKGLEIYPYSPKLKQENNEYAARVNEAIKIKVIEETKVLADQNEFETAMSMIRAAQEIYGNDQEYDTAYKEYKKMHALSEAETCRDNGDYAGVQFAVPGGRHSVLERPLSDENSRPFLVKTPAIIGY